MVIRNLILLLLLLVPLYSLTAFAKVTATVDRVIIEQGDTFTLTIKSDDESPELDVLEQNFNVLGTSQSSKISFANGSVSSEKEWIINLSPKKLGISVIPAIVAGNERTQAIQIQVVKSTAVNSAQGDDIYLEVALDINSAYVQSEVIYVARLFRAVEIRDGSLTEPEIPTAVVERMGEDVTYQTTRNQRRYQVTERRFAIFPQKSGNLVIAPTIFDGQVFVPRQTQPGRANDPFDRFFQSQQRMKRVRVKSDAIVLDVLPQPSAFKGENWLPAKRVILSESWSVDPPVFKVGEPVTRTLTIQAIGQTGAQLPEFKEMPTDGIKQYVDQPKVETGLSEGSLAGIREEKFAIIPTKSGELVLPELRLYWWDTTLDREQVVTIASRVIDVEPEALTAKQESRKETEIVAPVEATPSNDVQQAVSDIAGGLSQFGYWPLLALGLGLGWLLTLIGWVYHVKQRRPGPKMAEAVVGIDTASLAQAQKQLRAACEENNASQAKTALLAWSNAAWPEKTKTHSLIAVSERLHDFLQDQAISQAVANLDEVLYSKVAVSWNGAKFWTDVGQKLKKPRNMEPSKLKSLPELYPQAPQ